MNPNIALLARLPRGKAHQSRLIPHDDDIRRWRAAGETYRQITLYLEERDLKVSVAGVHAYVARRARRRKPLYQLPDPPAGRASSPTLASDLISPAPPQSKAQIPVVRYIPPPGKRSKFRVGDLDINDPFGNTNPQT